MKQKSRYSVYFKKVGQNQFKLQKWYNIVTSQYR